MPDGRILKPDKDFSKEADKHIPDAQELAKVVHLISPKVSIADHLYHIRTTFKRLLRSSHY